MLRKLKNRWAEEDGYKDILRMAVPLILSTGSLTLLHFVDRMFMAWYSPEAIAAAMPAGIINFTLMSLFFGTSAYVSAFTAQYLGAGLHHRIGPAVWQGLYFALLAGLVVLPLYPSAGSLFRLIGHAPEVMALEIDYFQILVFGGFAVTASSALSGFFGGLGQTKVVMWVSFVMTLVNIVLDYGLIFGKLGLPRMGIRGAALATVIAEYSQMLIYLTLAFGPWRDKRLGLAAGWRPDGELFRRLLRYGLPSGLHMMLETTGFALLILIMGQYGTQALAASNIAFNINHLAFMPVIGLSMGVSILVGNCLGQDRPDRAQRLTWSAFHMALLFLGAIGLAYVLAPHWFLAPYAAKAEASQFPAIAQLATKLLRFVALYVIFDGMNIVFAGAIKGAGDTRFVMTVSVVLSWLVMALPSWAAYRYFHWPLEASWVFLTAYIILLGMVFFLRFQGGRWKSMRVIEKQLDPVL